MLQHISVAQLRAARALLGWSQIELANAASLSRPSIERAERASVSAETLAAIQRALEAAGVEFTNGGEPGVKLRKGKRK